MTMTLSKKLFKFEIHSPSMTVSDDKKFIGHSSDPNPAPIRHRRGRLKMTMALSKKLFKSEIHSHPTTVSSDKMFIERTSFDETMFPMSMTTSCDGNFLR